jgi:hypothetical protein
VSSLAKSVTERTDTDFGALPIACCAAASVSPSAHLGARARTTVACGANVRVSGLAPKTTEDLESLYMLERI